MSRSMARQIILLVILVAATLLIKNMVLGGARVVKLRSAEPLSGIVSQNLIGSSFSESSLPVVNKDYKLDEVKFFDDRSWVSVKVSPLNGDTDRAILVLKKSGSEYTLVLGPGTAFPSSDLSILPSDLASYLSSKGIIYEH